MKQVSLMVFSAILLSIGILISCQEDLLETASQQITAADYTHLTLNDLTELPNPVASEQFAHQLFNLKEDKDGLTEKELLSIGNPHQNTDLAYALLFVDKYDRDEILWSWNEPADEAVDDRSEYGKWKWNGGDAIASMYCSGFKKWPAYKVKNRFTDPCGETLEYGRVYKCEYSLCNEIREIDENYNPAIIPANFTNPTTFTNPFFSQEVGKKFIFEGETEDGLERIEVEMLNGTIVIMGITCAVIEDKVYLDGDLIEDTKDWFAQDNDGNVWYFGEDSKEIEGGVVVSTEGSWEAGVDGAKPGIIMLANPQVGDSYRQEYYFMEAEDEAEVVELNVTVEIDLGTYTGCLKTREWTELEPDVEEFKYYAPGIGVIKEENLEEEVEIVLVEIIN